MNKMFPELSPSPLIFNIVRGSFADGPGIRSVVFLKGCPLRCAWCHNPESQNPQQEAWADGSGKDDGKIGQYREPEELVQLLLQDKIFYETSGGGVTFSGGEPFLFPEYLIEVCTRLKQHKIHIAMDTCGEFEMAAAEPLLPLVDLLLYDLKIADSEQHRIWTGMPNQRILKNLRTLSKKNMRVEIRILLVPGINDSESNAAEIARICGECGITEYSLLPYYPLGNEKLKNLNRRIQPQVPDSPLSLAEQERLKSVFSSLIHSSSAQGKTNAAS